MITKIKMLEKANTVRVKTVTWTTITEAMLDNKVPKKNTRAKTEITRRTTVIKITRRMTVIKITRRMTVIKITRRMTVIKITNIKKTERTETQRSKTVMNNPRDPKNNQTPKNKTATHNLKNLKNNPILKRRIAKMTKREIRKDGETRNTERMTKIVNQRNQRNNLILERKIAIKIKSMMTKMEKENGPINTEINTKTQRNMKKTLNPNLTNLTANKTQKTTISSISTVKESGPRSTITKKDTNMERKNMAQSSASMKRTRNQENRMNHNLRNGTTRKIDGKES